MTWAAGKRIVREEVKQDARTKGSRHGAEENLNAFYQLSFLLTRDHEKAERCFVAGIEHLVRGKRAFNQWAHSWAKRIIVESAIRELKPRLRQSNFYPLPATFPYTGDLSSTPRGHFEPEAILALSRANCLRAVRPGSLFSRRLCRPSWLLDFRNSASPYARSA